MGRPRKPEHRVEHGSPAGWSWHMRHGVDPCGECEAAHRKQMREHRAKYRDLRRKQRDKIRAIMSGSQESSRYKATNREVDAIIEKLKEHNIDPLDVPTE